MPDAVILFVEPRFKTGDDRFVRRFVMLGLPERNLSQLVEAAMHGDDQLAHNLEIGRIVVQGAEIARQSADGDTGHVGELPLREIVFVLQGIEIRRDSSQYRRSLSNVDTSRTLF